jgi:chemotaxis protein histidine kinase CheA
LEAGQSSERETLALCEDWREFAARIAPVIESKEGTIEIARAEYEALSDAVGRAGAPREIADLVRSLRYEPVQEAFARMAEHAQSLAQRLGKHPLRVEIEGGDVKLDPESFGVLWPAFLHAVRNAVDHGIEMPDERELLGKPRSGLLRFAASLDDGSLCISLEDDGRGVDWGAIGRKAELAGLPHDTQADLEAALFAEGISTRDEATELSGRGVGASALEAAVRALGGRIELCSRRAQGLRISLHFEAASRLGARVTPTEANRATPGASVDVPARGAAA